ncbi:MAG: tetratricopeptide repeat protein, partial [bacterium]
MTQFMKLMKKQSIFIFAMVLLTSSGCVYYNTFYNARQAFNEAEKTRKSSGYDQQKINQSQYKIAIEKSLKVVENYPNSKYYDDALYVLGVSYYYTNQYSKAERRFREIIANYENSKYINDAYLYRAKSKLELGETEEAMEAFEDLLNEDLSREFKAEAAMGLAMYNFQNRRYDDSKRYFLAIRDTLGSGSEKKVAQQYIADGYFEQFRFEDARGAYLQILGMEPDLNERYHALVRASACSYRLMKIEEGLDYINTLMEDERYFDSLYVLMMNLAEGYEYEADVEQSEAIYQKVANEAKQNLLSQTANYRLGLIYQYDFDDLTKAKEYYDAAALKGKSTENGQLAIQKSSDIGKLDEFVRTITIDSTTTMEMIDEAAYIQYQLAELLWFKLNKPDTAILEMQYVVDSFPMSYDAPKAMIALSQMVLDYESDTAKSDSIIHAMLSNYPHSDYVPEALEYLGLLGTEADTGYAGAYLKKAEEYLVDEQNIDSARYYYQIIVNRFTESEYY